MNRVLAQAANRGEELARELLEDRMERAKELTRQKLLNMGVQSDYAEALVDQAHEAVSVGAGIIGDMVMGREGNSAGASVEEVVQTLRETVRNLSATSALAFAGFFLRHRFLPLFDMLSDVLVAAELCTGDPGLVSGVGGLLRGECNFDVENGALRRVFFTLTCIFFVLIWAALWLALGMHVLRAPAYGSENEEFRKKGSMRPLTMVLYDWVFGWRGIKDKRPRVIAFIILSLPMLAVVELPGVLLGLLGGGVAVLLERMDRKQQVKASAVQLRPMITPYIPSPLRWADMTPADDDLTVDTPLWTRLLPQRILRARRPL